jgi:hypothetical protein
MTNLLQKLVDCGIRIRCVSGPGAWCEVDGSADIHLYQRLLDESDRGGNRWDHDWRW